MTTPSAFTRPATLALVLVAALASPALAGPPLVCFPFEIGNARVDTIPWRPAAYDLVPRFDVTTGDEIWVLGRKPFPDEESLQKLPPGLSLVAADGFDPNIRVFRVTAS